MVMYKGVILLAGPSKGTRFRPLSMDVPKPLFNVAGLPLIEHHVEALAKVKDLKHILLLGFYPPQQFQQFVNQMSQQYPGIGFRYLQEFQPLGTAGGFYHFRDQIRSGNPDAIFVMNGDVCSDFPLEAMLETHSVSKATLTIMTTEATRQQSLNYGCVVEDKANHGMLHYVEKPSTYISSLVNTGVYIVTQDIFNNLKTAFEKKQGSLTSAGVDGEDNEVLWFERDVLPQMAGKGSDVRVFQTKNWWSPVKTAASAVYANRHYLDLYHKKRPDRLAKGDGGFTVVGNVFVHPTARVHASAVVGPNVSLGPHVEVGEGARIKESIVLERSVVMNHAVVMHTIVGVDAKVGDWCRVEGTPNDPNPNKPFAKMDNTPLFNPVDGKLNPSITIVGSNVHVPAEIILLNSIVLPHKSLGHSIKNEIVL